MKVSELFEAKAAVKVTARKNPNGTHGPTGTFTVKAFEVDGDSVYVKISKDGGWGISLKTPPAFLKFTAANGMPITLKSAIEMMKPIKESLNEGFAIKLKSGSWYSEERPTLGPLKGGNSQVRVFKSMDAADDFLIKQQNSKFGGKKFEDAEIKTYRPKKLKEGFEAELTDAIKLNWLSWSVSKIVAHLKLQMKSGKWPELKGKSDDELHDYVDNAKDDARNQVDESLNEGVYVIKNKDGKEKRFKDHTSPEAVAWKASSSPKKSTVKLAVYSDAYWAKKEDDAHDKDDYDFVTPWKPIKNDYAATDKINAVVEGQFNTDKIDWTLGKGSEIKREGTTCAAIVVRVMYEYGPEDDMGVDEPVQDAQNILVARNPKKPAQLDFVQFV